MKKTEKHDWTRADALAEEQIHAAALSDPDAQPLTDADFARMRLVPRTISMRLALRLTQEDFASRYRIPLDTLRDWEERRVQPNQTERAYLRAIAGDPDGVYRALNPPGRNAAE